MADAAHIKEIKARISLSSIVRAAVELKGRSPNFMGLCPFHQEKTPSFHVRDGEMRFKCFGCGASGDIFAFVMRLRGLSFPEAVQELGRQAGLYHQPKPITHTQKKPATIVVDALKAQSIAQKYFQHQLNQPAGQKAKEYLLEQRGLSEKMITQAGLGFGGMIKEDFFAYLKSHGVSKKIALESGLIKEGKFSLGAQFLSRITFPIHDLSGQLVAFGGRAFLKSDHDAPKYVNTHSYHAYEKRKNFYGWAESKTAMLAGKTPILVEGYFDAMALWALGMPALALCGTAVSEQHVKILRTMSARVILCYDTDAAGHKALLASLIELSQQNITAEVLLLNEKDPGVYLEKKNLPQLKAHLEHRVDALCHVIDHAALSSQSNISQRIKEIDSLLPIFVSIKRPLIRRQYVMYLASKLNEDASLLWQEINKKLGNESCYQKKSESISLSVSPDERLMISIALSTPELLSTMDEVLPLASEEVQAVLAIIATQDHVQVLETIKQHAPNLAIVVAEIMRDGIALSPAEAHAIIDAFKRKRTKLKWREGINEKAIELHNCEKKGDFLGALNHLREKSALLNARKAKIKAQAMIAPVVHAPPGKTSKFVQLDNYETYFNVEEDWS